jgi:hypothetical protein
LIDGGRAQLQLEPVVQELADAGTRTAQAQVQRTNQARQGGADQMPLGQLDRPSLFALTTTRLGTRPMDRSRIGIPRTCEGCG